MWTFNWQEIEWIKNKGKSYVWISFFYLFFLTKFFVCFQLRKKIFIWIKIKVLLLLRLLLISFVHLILNYNCANYPITVNEHHLLFLVLNWQNENEINKCVRWTWKANKINKKQNSKINKKTWKLSTIRSNRSIHILSPGKNLIW